METVSIYEAIGRNLGDVLVKGVPTNCTASMLASPILTEPVIDQLKGKDLFIYMGAGAGQAREITAFTPGSKAVQIGQSFDTIPTTNSKFLIFSHFKAEDYENAMNRAFGIVRLKNLVETSGTIITVGTQYEYPVPSGMEFVNSLRIVPSGGSNYSDYEVESYVNSIYEIPPRNFRIEINPLGSYVIAIDPRKISLDFFDGKSLRIMGQSKPDLTGTVTSEKLQEYIIAEASMIMSSTRIDEGQEWKVKFYMFRDMTKELENYVYTPRRGKQVG